MTTRIVIKNSTVAGKVPTASDLVNAELAINLVDKKLYSKDAGGNVFEVGAASVGQGPTPPSNGNETGDLWWDGDVLLVWNGSSWEVVGGVTSVNGETGEVVLDLGDLNDVTLSPLSNGDIIAWNGTAWVNTAAPPADISGSSINDLNDVDTNGVDDGDILIWNQAAGEWQATNRGTVPENTSDLNNDGENGTDPFITEADVNNILAGNKPDGTPDPSAPGYLQPGDNVSELNNDAGYITDAGVTKIVAGTNITIDPATGEGEVTINAADAAALALDDLTDVNVPSPDDGDVLSYNGSNWVSSAAPPADISGSSINQLNDVDASGASSGQILVWNGSNWVNTDAPDIPEKTSDLTNDGNGDAGEVFITTGEVTNILNGLKPDGSPDASNPGYLKPGDNVSELNNDAGYLTSSDKAGDSDKLGGQDPDYYLNYQNFTNIPDMVDKIIAGTGIEISPVEGTGDVTINSTVSSTEFVGPVDVTSSVVPAQVRSANALYVNTGFGKFSPEWAAVTTNADINTDANPGDFMMKDLDSQASDPWTWIEAGTPPASDGLWVEGSGKLSPATLSNDVLVGGADATAAKIQLNANGTATFAAGGGVNIDSSGRLLVGTSSSSQNVSIVAQGSSSGSTQRAQALLALGASNPADGNTLGILAYSDSGHTPAAWIFAARDGGTWTSGSSQPTRLVFSTTADGSSSPTERMRISSDGSATFAGNVGIGSNSPSVFGSSSSLVVQKNGSGESAAVNILGSSTGSSLIRFANGTDTASERNAGSISVNHNDGSMQFGLQDAEKLRIDSSGNTLIGGTLSSSPNISLNANGSATFASTITAGGFRIDLLGNLPA